MIFWNTLEAFGQAGGQAAFESTGRGAASTPCVSRKVSHDKSTAGTKSV
jgi:hypothetical protein